MSRGVLIIFSLYIVFLLGCDTKSNVQPRNEDFFIKFYAGVNAGNQFANDIIATSDGGLLIVGTSENKGEPPAPDTKELILIKTDAKGNQDWIYGAFQDLQKDSEGKSVLEIPGVGYVVGGTVDDGGIQRSILMSISIAGGLTNSVIIKTDEGLDPKSNQLSKITLGNTGILVSGQTNHIANGKGGKNGFVRLHNESNLDSIPVGIDYVQYIGTEGEDNIIGAFEVSDVSNIGTQSSKFLIFGTTDNGIPNEKDFFYMGLTDQFSRSPDIGKSTIINKSESKQTGHYITQYNDTYWMIGESDLNSKQIMLTGWEFTPDSDTDWNIIIGSNNEINTTESVAGKGVAVRTDGKIVLVGNIEISIDHTELYLARVDQIRTIRSPWPKIYGTASSIYSASAVTVLTDGSIVIVGTADLQPIKKIIVIKTGPDGQMSF